MKLKCNQMMYSYKFYFFLRDQSLKKWVKYLKILIINKRFYLFTEIFRRSTRIETFNRLPTKIENLNRLPTKLLNSPHMWCIKSIKGWFTHLQICFPRICFRGLIYCDQEPLWLLNVIEDVFYFLGVHIRRSTPCKK